VRGSKEAALADACLRQQAYTRQGYTRLTRAYTRQERDRRRPRLIPANATRRDSIESMNLSEHAHRITANSEVRNEISQMASERSSRIARSAPVAADSEGEYPLHSQPQSPQ
jgi:hypothetical protein